jgi:hypothetical protein
VPDESDRSSSSFGKRQEYVAIAELLRRGHDVYQTLVDDQGIDCVLRREVNSSPKYIDLQIKARSKKAAIRDAAYFGGHPIPNPRPNYLFMFFSERAQNYWVIPSLKLVNLVNTKKTGKHVGDWAIRLGIAHGEIVRPRPKFREFEGEAGIKLLDRVFSELA